MSGRKSVSVIALIAGVLTGTDLYAQSVAPLDEIVVTAQRRTESLKNVPVAITSVSAAQAEAAGIETTNDLSLLVPGLKSYQATGFVMPHLRGIGNTVDSVGVENPVAIY